jgi:O-antigen ligase
MGEPGLGFISYNHAYTAIQLILSGGAAYLFSEHSRRIRMLICSLLLMCSFLSGSRSGFITAIVLVLALEWKRAGCNILPLFLLCGLGSLWIAQSIDVDNYIDRQSSSASSLDDDGLSGRTGIWQDHLDYFSNHPLNLLFGTGFGYGGKASDSNAHMLYFHVMTETGLAGLLVFMYIQRRTLLMCINPRLRTMRLTILALLITGVTQDSLYPTPAFTHFLGFYLSVLVISLRYVGQLGVSSMNRAEITLVNLQSEGAS